MAYKDRTIKLNDETHLDHMNTIRQGKLGHQEHTGSNTHKTVHNADNYIVILCITYVLFSLSVHKRVYIKADLYPVIIIREYVFKVFSAGIRKRLKGSRAGAHTHTHTHFLLYILNILHSKLLQMLQT